MSGSHWVILVKGYGAFLFEGPEEDAEAMRAHKAQWERSPAMKRPADQSEVEQGKASSCWNHGGFGDRIHFADCPCPDQDCLAKALARA